MNPETNQSGTPQQAQPAAASQDNPKNPFKEDAPITEPDPQEKAENEQKRKEALTERD